MDVCPGNRAQNNLIILIGLLLSVLGRRFCHFEHDVQLNVKILLHPSFCNVFTRMGSASHYIGNFVFFISDSISTD